MRQGDSLFEQFIAVLGKNLHLTGREIADILWLLQSEPAPVTQEKPEPIVTPSPSSSDPHSEPPSPTDRREPAFPQPPPAEIYTKTETATAGQAISIPIPDVSTLEDPLDLARALRPLMLRVASGEEWTVDEQATAERIAQTRIRIPVLQPSLEPWLELALVVDESLSMIFWRKTVENLQQLLTHYGVFRDVRTWGLIADNQGKLSLRRGFGKKAQGQRLRDLKEIVDPTGRRAILVVSDCIAPIWYDGQALAALKIWSKYNPTAIVQMLPERLWLRTGLSLGASVLLGSLTPGSTNQSLSVKKILLWNAVNLHQGLKVPVFSLEPQMALAWSEMVAGKSNEGASGTIFPLQIDYEAEILSELAEDEVLSSQERVRRFRSVASETARQLAILLAAAPIITMPIVRLIKKILLPQARQAHVAEVFFGDLLNPLSKITPETESDEVQYEFIEEEIRDIFLGFSTRTESSRVLEAVSRYVARQLGKNLVEFNALVKKPTSENASIKGLQIKPFARVQAKVLKRLGGVYTDLANQLETLAKETPKLKTILLVEDNPETVEEIGDILTNRGKFEVIHCEDFGQIMNYARSGTVDLILLNYWLNHTFYQNKKMTGVDIAKRIRADSAICSDLVIIGFSIFAEKELDFRPYCNSFFQKPVQDAQHFINYLTEVFNSKTGQPAKPGKHYAIAIGINQYRNLPTLQYAVRDAEVMREWFRRAGLTEVHFLREVNYGVLQDFLRSHFPSSSLTSNDTFWFFFSGYGVYREGKDYLLLADSDLEALDRTALPLTELVRQLQTTGAGKIILLLDVDRDRSFYQGRATTRVAPTNNEITSLEQQLQSQLSSDCSLAILYAASPQQGAYEIEQLQQGSFSYALQQALSQTQGNISLEQLYQFLSDRITQLNERYNRPPQTPQLFTHPADLRQWIPFPSTLQVFQLTTPTVNRRGEIIQQDTYLAQYFTETLSPSPIVLEMVAIPGGKFLMGSLKGEGDDSERPQHEVTVPPFLMGKYPITQAQWRAVASLPTIERELKLEPSRFKGNDKLPVEQVSWYDAVEFCKRLSELTQKDYRLPSEAEWEYACRAIQNSKFKIQNETYPPFYFGETITSDLANYDGNYTYAEEAKGEYREKTTPVGQFPSNAFGLYDMHGNVWEWCTDAWHDNYEGAPTDGSAWIDNDNYSRRLLRGGSWDDNPRYCRCANRLGDEADNRYGFLGIRVICVARTENQ